MRTYKDITDEMQTIANETQEAREMLRELNRKDKRSDFITWKTRYNYLMIKYRALKNNSLCAFANDYKKPIMDILNKYAGKKLGPKTLEKIQTEFKEKLQMTVYFSKGYCDTIFVGSLGADGYLKGNYFHLRSNNVFVDNTLGKISDITTHEKYIEDIDAYILNLVKMQHELEELSQRTYKLASKYNGAKLEGMKQADYYKEFYNGYFEEWI